MPKETSIFVTVVYQIQFSKIIIALRRTQEDFECNKNELYSPRLFHFKKLTDTVHCVPYLH